MIILPVSELRPGMTLYQSVFAEHGTFLLKSGTVLTPQLIQKVRNFSIPRVAVTGLTPLHSVTIPQDIVHDYTKQEALLALSSSLENFRSSGIFFIQDLQDAVYKIIEEIFTNNGQALIQMNNVRSHDSYTLVHSINVAVLATFLGIINKLSLSDLKELTLGALLHDVGKNCIPENILNKKEPLTNDEFTLIKNHPLDSLSALKKAGCFSESIMSIASQHHEKIDGSGYPFHLKDKQIHPFAKMVSIADVFDALTSERAYKRAYKPHIAYNIMSLHSPNSFQSDYLQKFFDNIAIYPVGSVVKLNIGIAIVSKVFPEAVLTPIVKVFADNDCHKLKTSLTLDLAQERGVSIDCVYSDKELYNLYTTMDFDPQTLL